jgi:glycolate oxidase iron-sulfur subunit
VYRSETSEVADLNDPRSVADSDHLQRVADGSHPLSGAGQGVSVATGHAGNEAADGAFDSHRPPPAELVADCVHCGFCLPTCPSYLAFEEEMDSPRGRIVLIDVARQEGESISEQMLSHFDRCLGCMACVTACPSGVRYDELIARTRPQLERRGPRTKRQRLLRKAIFALFTHPRRLRLTVPLLALRRRVGLAHALAPKAGGSHLRAALALAPAVTLRSGLRRLPRHTLPARRAPQRRGAVAFMQGCIQRVYFGDVNAATVRVLSAEGFEVHAPAQPRCCGALQFHSGFEPEAVELAKQTIAAYERYETIVVNVAGCGSAMKEYGELLGEDPSWAGRARAFSAKVLDVHELLARHEPQARRHPLQLRLAYHDACHLAHAQGVREQPRSLLRGIPGLELIEPSEWELCCGSAGIYNLTEPEAAAQLGRRKAANLAATGASAIAAANPGCALQIAAHLSTPTPIYHPITILDRSLRGASL